MSEPLPSARAFDDAELPGRALSSAEQMDHHLGRRGEVDERGPELRTMIEINPDAMSDAMSRDTETRDGDSRGPLHGLAVAVKDNIDTADAMSTTAGSVALIGTHPITDATIVARLRTAGLVLIGKANLSEWANFRSPRSTSGWSGRGGLTRNPWDPTRSAGGSSSGSAAAVAAGVAPLAIGTETDGSIICPASYCGVVGLKPTVGLLPGDGIVPISRRQDAPGPIARSVRLAAALLDAMAGSDSYLAACSADRLDGLRVGVVRDHFGAHAGADQLIETAIGLLGAAGATIVDQVPATAFPEWDDADDPYLLALLHEFHRDLTSYLASRPPGGPQTIADVVELNRQHAATELAWFGQEYLEQAAALTPDEDAWHTAVRTITALAVDGLSRSFEDRPVDLLVAPAFPPAALSDLVLGDPQGPGGDCTTAPAIAGYPILSLPVGFVHGLPVGVALTGRPTSEALLLRVAHSLEGRLELLASGALVPASR